jgi:hypothetical protein
MSIVTLYTYVLTKLQSSLVAAAKKSQARADVAHREASKVLVKARRVAADHSAKGTTHALEATQLAERAAKLKALL